jgi:hypothetical protein
MIPKKNTPRAVALIVLKIDVHLILVYITTLSTKGGVLPRKVMAPVVIMDISPWLLTKCTFQPISYPKKSLKELLTNSPTTLVFLPYVHCYLQKLVVI